MARITKQPRIITITLYSTKNKLLFLLPISNSLSSTSLLYPLSHFQFHAIYRCPLIMF